MAKRLYLIPQGLAPQTENMVIPPVVRETVSTLRCFIVEDIASAQRFLKKLDPQFPLAECKFLVFDEHARLGSAQDCLASAPDNAVGIISEAGCPCVADPGAAIVRLAQDAGWEVVPLPGPSSLILALMASGLNGQNFAFNGYLPKERNERIKKIRDLERRASNEQQTQILMEAPYRNQKLFEELLANCSPDTLLCVAADLTAPGQFVQTRAIRDWRRNKPDLDKKPALFLIGKN